MSAEEVPDRFNDAYVSFLESKAILDDEGVGWDLAVDGAEKAARQILKAYDTMLLEHKEAPNIKEDYRLLHVQDYILPLTDDLAKLEAEVASPKRIPGRVTQEGVANAAAAVLLAALGVVAVATLSGGGDPSRGITGRLRTGFQTPVKKRKRRKVKRKTRKLTKRKKTKRKTRKLN